MVDAQGSHFYLQDALGCVVGLASPAGAVEASYAYEPFGAQRTTSVGSPTGVVNPMRFAGERVDEGTGLYHLRARQYDPGTGTFLQTDPVQPAIDDPFVASYVYANNRPTVLVDPLGLFGLRGLLGLVTTAAGVVAVVALVAGSGGVLGVAGLIGAGAGIGLAVMECTDGGFDPVCKREIGWAGFSVVALPIARSLGRFGDAFSGLSGGAGLLRR